MHRKHNKVIILATLFIKEQLKEPISIFWIMISPCALFYFFGLTRQQPDFFTSSYTSVSAWFYAYISSSVALFGFAFYIIGRRESGFIRSFIHSKTSRRTFLLSHLLAYSLISLIYCFVFYLATKPPFGAYDLREFLTTVPRFYICFLLFCGIGGLLTIPPINFQNSSTLFSILSFSMLIIGVMGEAKISDALELMNWINPLTITSQLMTNGLDVNRLKAALIILFFFASFFTLFRYLRINPVWSRY